MYVCMQPRLQALSLELQDRGVCLFARHAKKKVKTNSLLCMLSHWLEKPVYIHIKQQQIIEAMRCAYDGKDASFWLTTGLGKSPCHKA